ncbi:helix-turn-helix domain-containing protein [Streptomyces xanthophaeus]|uniref:helix-turn-helix domain-containing protein n=1 Tax=Streptomyces xanthophaeus TaxID=67385 RepID=UPI0039903084
MTHVLLPVSGLSRQADAVEVIGTALEMKAAGAGHRTIADRLGRPATTVRGWLRRFASRAAVIAGVFTSHLVTLADDPSLMLPTPALPAFADAVAAVARGAVDLPDLRDQCALLAGPGGDARMVSRHVV